MRLPATLPSKFLTPAVEQLLGVLFAGIAGGTKRKYSYEAMEDALISNPVVNAACEVRIALSLSAMGYYTHEDEALQDEIRKGIANYKGNFQDDVARLMSYLPYGFSYTECCHEVTAAGGARLKGFRTLNQMKTNFEGEKGEIKTVRYPSYPEDVYIKYETGIHLTNQPYLLLNNDPKGVAIMDRVMPFYEAYNLLLAALVIAGQRQATPILVGKTDTSASTYLLNADGTQMINPNTGQPIQVYQGEAMSKSLEEVQNGSVLVIDRLDEVIAIMQQTTGDMLMSALDFLTGMMMLAFLEPRTILYQSPTGVGDAGLAEFHGKTFREIIRRDVVKVGDAIVEKVLKPEITWNHGEQEDYGQFPVNESELANAAQMIGAIASAVQNGALAGSEPEAGDRIKQLAGIA